MDAVCKVLEINNTSKYFIVYNNGAANHLTSALVGMGRLGATEERLQKFVQWYSRRLEKPTGTSAQKWQSTETDIQKLKGSRSNYYLVLDYYLKKFKEEYEKNLELMVRNEFGKLYRGMVGAAFHGMIHVGYAYSLRSPHAVCEGLAYFHVINEPLKQDTQVDLFGSGDIDILDVLNLLKNDPEIVHYMQNEKERGNLKVFFYRRLIKMLKEKTDEVVRFVNQIRLPVQELETMEDALSLCRWILDCAILIYTKSEYKNDFYFVHAVTSSWSMLQILQTCTEPQSVIGPIQTYLCCLLAAYMCEGSPALNNDLEEDLLQYKDWEKIVEVALDNESDEHIYKLVQVVHDLSKETGDGEKQLLYKSAANIALNNKLFAPLEPEGCKW